MDARCLHGYAGARARSRVPPVVPPGFHALMSQSQALPCTGVVFDLDGTLVDSAPDLMNALNHALVSCGRDAVGLAAVRGMIGDGLSVLVRRGFEATGGVPQPAQLEEAVQACLHYYLDHADDQSVLYPGVDSTLRELKAAGLKLAVCTNKPEQPAVALLDALGIGECFETVAGADTFPYRKPDPRVLLDTLAAMGLAAEDAVMVGDSRNDALASHGAKVPFVLVGFGYLNATMEELAPTAVVQDFAELAGGLLVARTV